jgi:hypothetical protein
MRQKNNLPAQIVRDIMAAYPRSSNDDGWNKWLSTQWTNIFRSEIAKAAFNESDKAAARDDIAATVDALDPIFEMVESVYSQYWNAHCVWIGPANGVPGRDRWIYNRILGAVWYPTSAKGGHWVRRKDGYIFDIIRQPYIPQN